ncbi:hypothetical protein LCGC14_2640210, partial [marine sediment metagenome]
KILIITGLQSYPIIKKLIGYIKLHSVEVIKAPISVSAFLSESMARELLESVPVSNYDLILLPGFIQWDTSSLEKKISVEIRKGPEFASDLQMILKNLSNNNIKLSNKIPANRLFEDSGKNAYHQIVKEQYESSLNNIGSDTFFINEERSNILVGRNLPPPIIAEIVNCTTKSNKSIIKKAQHYISSGADIIDIGCVANNPNPTRITEIIELLRTNFNTLISIDSMEKSELLAAVESGIDLILSLDSGNYKDFINISKEIPIVILPTNIKKGYFPKDPKTRVENLLNLTEKLQDYGFKKLIADPLLETPIVPGICNSLEAYFLYSKLSPAKKLPLFFGISNVVELMDIDSVGINGLLASIAVELDIGVVFTVEHSIKLMRGVTELKEGIKLNYLSKYKRTPPINQGIQIFRAKGKTKQLKYKFSQTNGIYIDQLNQDYIPDEVGYFKISLNHY